MPHTPRPIPHHLFTAAAICAAALALGSANGCKKSGTAAVADDTSVANNVRTALTTDPSIRNEAIQAAVNSGVVTLSGNVSNDTARLVASEDASRVAGVKQVLNNLTVAGMATAPTTTPAAIAPVSTPTTGAVAPGPVTRSVSREEREALARHQATLPPPQRTVVAGQHAGAPPQQQQAQNYGPGPMPPAPIERPQPMAPPPPPPPVVHDLHIQPGTVIPVRMTQTLDSETAQPDTRFTGVLTAPLLVDGIVALPAGAPVTGRVTDVQEAAHFKGHSLLSVTLTGINSRGEHFNIATEPYTVEGKNRGKNTAEKIGGGAAVGAVLGGIFGGGKGAAIGAAAGGGAGGVANGVTRGQQVQIPSESVVRFRLTSGFTVRTVDRPDNRDYGPRDNNQGLQPRY